jgi:hypothetical protein
MCFQVPVQFGRAATYYTSERSSKAHTALHSHRFLSSHSISCSCNHSLAAGKYRWLQTWITLAFNSTYTWKCRFYVLLSFDSLLRLSSSVRRTGRYGSVALPDRDDVLVIFPCTILAERLQPPSRIFAGYLSSFTLLIMVSKKHGLKKISIFSRPPILSHGDLVPEKILVFNVSG